MVRIVPRGHTACADAYLTPTIQRYVQGFRRGFQGQLKVRVPDGLLLALDLYLLIPSLPAHPCPQDVQMLFMRSDGGLAPMDAFSGSRAVLSGPAGGVVGYSATTYQLEGSQPVIGFDMGGMEAEGRIWGEVQLPGWVKLGMRVSE
jgi:5-oxoprolinase (ATP-hydrolysing)